MIGDSIARLARRLVRAATYEAMVAPAIADLQHESRAGWRSSLRAYAGAWRAVAGATMDETAQDTAGVLSGLMGARALRPAAWMLLLVSIAWLAPLAWNGFGNPAPTWLLTILAAPSIVAIAALPAVTMAAHGAARRTRRVRGFVVTGVFAGALLLVLVD